VSGNDEESEATREERLRRAVASVAGFDLRKQDDGKCQIVFVSTLTGEALPIEDDLTLDDVEWWVDENVVKDEQQ
jgi:hypothetical protein